MDAYVEAPTVQEVSAPAPDAFRTALQGAENSVRAGYGEVYADKWTPHVSLEGGTATLAYGHKLTDAENRTRVIKIDGQPVPIDRGLDETQAQALYDQDVKTAQDRLRRTWPGYDGLPDKYKNVLTNISFNIGAVRPDRWPSLSKAMDANDDVGVRKEMVTSYEDANGVRQRLSSRAQNIADAIGLGTGAN